MAQQHVKLDAETLPNAILAEGMMVVPIGACGEPTIARTTGRATVATSVALDGTNCIGSRARFEYPLLSAKFS